jgi:hypothetical protein
MKSTTNGGLLAGELIPAAANDDSVSRVSKAPARRDDVGNPGWDPFEVWRTRVKEPRERHAPSLADRSKA